MDHPRCIVPVPLKRTDRSNVQFEEDELRIRIKYDGSGKSEWTNLSDERVTFKA